MAYFRSKPVNELYKEHQETEEFKTTCVLCTAVPLQTFTYWKIMQARFPYDLIAGTHHMLLPLRHVSELELTVEEVAEFMEIKHSDPIQHFYDNFIESTHKTRSIPPHFHLHMVILKK